MRFVRAGVTSFALDLTSPGAGGTGMTVTEVTSGDRTLTFTHDAGRLRIALAAAPAAGAIESFTVVYHGRPGEGLSITTNGYGDRTVFADNFPDRARDWLPTVDHPSDKATCDFVVDAPADEQVVANGRLVEETDLAGGRRRTHWREAEPIATYLMVVGVAHFAVQYVDEMGDVPVETWVYPQDRDKGFFDFARTRRVLEFFSDRIGPYDYEKLANVESTTRYGGMENASNIFYTERAVTGTRRVESTVVHEVAHQWFGDAVTESDWNHAWLSEGFATYFTHLFDEWAYGRDRLEAGMARDRDEVLEFADRNPDLRVVDDRVPIRKVLSPYTYEKGGWVLHMLRRRVGDEAFWAGIRDLLPHVPQRQRAQRGPRARHVGGVRPGPHGLLPPVAVRAGPARARGHVALRRRAQVDRPARRADAEGPRLHVRPRHRRHARPGRHGPRRDRPRDRSDPVVLDSRRRGAGRGSRSTRTCGSCTRGRVAGR